MVMEPHASVIAAAHQSTTLHAYLGHAPWASSPLLVRAIAAVVEYMSVELMEQVRGISTCTVRTNSHVMWRVCGCVFVRAGIAGLLQRPLGPSRSSDAPGHSHCHSTRPGDGGVARGAHCASNCPTTLLQAAGPAFLAAPRSKQRYAGGLAAVRQCLGVRVPLLVDHAQLGQHTLAGLATSLRFGRLRWWWHDPVKWAYCVSAWMRGLRGGDGVWSAIGATPLAYFGRTNKPAVRRCTWPSARARARAHTHTHNTHTHTQPCVRCWEPGSTVRVTTAWLCAGSDSRRSTPRVVAAGREFPGAAARRSRN